jgi:hypothetical protein
MIYQLYDCECPDDCTARTLPAVSFADCVEGVDEELSEISEIYLDDITLNPTSGEEEFTDLPTSVASAGPSWYGDARRLLVVGDLPEGTQTSRTLHKGWVKKGVSTWQLTADIMDTNDTNYNFIKSLQCGWRVGLAWATMGGKIYGSVIASVVSSDWVLARGEDAYSIGKLVLEIKADCLPDRADDPEAGGGGGGTT